MQRDMLRAELAKSLEHKKKTDQYSMEAKQHAQRVIYVGLYVCVCLCVFAYVCLLACMSVYVCEHIKLQCLCSFWTSHTIQ